MVGEEIFYFLSFKEQTNHSPNDYEKVASDSIVKVPLQTVHEPENIWNSNADNKQDSLSTRDFSSYGFVVDKESLNVFSVNFEKNYCFA